MRKNINQMVSVSDEELRQVQGGSAWGWLKKVGRWIKKHVRVTKKSISIKGKHDIGGGGK